MLFFNGRLYISPAVASRVDDTAMFNRNPAVGNILALIGPADGGQPKTALRFGSASEAAAVLRGGELLDAVIRAFACTVETPGPSTIVAMRTQPATRSTLNLLDNAAQTVITLTSEVWGALANRVQVMIADGTTLGKRVRTKLDNLVHEADNIGRNVLSVSYTGAATSATVTVTASGLTLAAPAGSALPEITFASAPTIAALAERISLTPDWTATILDNSDEHPTAGTLDFVTAADAKNSPRTLTAHLEALVRWFNSEAESLVTASKTANAGTLPINTLGTFLAGATTGTTTTQDWQDCFTALQAEDVQWVVPISGDAAIHAMTAAHCKFASDILARERRAIVGTPLGTNDGEAITRAKALNSDRVSLVNNGIYDYDTAGRLTLYAPYIAAAMIGGGFSGVNPGTAMTNKALAVRGLERRTRYPTDTDQLLIGGVMPLAEGPTGYRVVQSITTWLVNDNYNRREASVGAAVDYTARSVRQALAPVIGKKNGPAAIVEAMTRVRSTLEELARPEPQGIGVLVGDKQRPPFRNIRITADGDVLRVDFECLPVIPVNYIPITIFAVPYSGTATV